MKRVISVLKNLKANLRFPKLKFQQFPHISRSIPANLILRKTKRISFWFLSFLIVLNIIYYQQSEFIQLREDVFRGESLKTHLNLASYYLSLNDQANTKREFILADSFFMPNKKSGKNVLGIESSPIQTWNNIVNARKINKEEIAKWVEITDKFPNYKTGFLNLAILNLKVGNKEEAKKYMFNLEELDPGNQILNDLKKYF
ncbi:MAG: hypothetical protein UT63_C0006G0010 [Candidatus Gottesmanbacteria bacterium GW2011_GWC2_39_8]|uniref:Uncharacterized protein n=1 Tax=Candidatus Gottesmanbacteria bacterium GW2011_GWC2_39_8 TaxID=1618450 RepID=A0A0G0T8B2_9BACT|nr:MAG: hypothetical protein UT63_C0006G0010 [Candidatus Gottesmanbacteria bacterium GW2011_GWC2_39_8]